MKDGVININKGKQMTSFDVVAILRSVLKIKKIGHTGTLDPDATGVLPVCIGKATKLVSLLENTDKAYRARMLLGVKTDTQDISGSVLEKADPDQVAQILSGAEAEERIRNVFARFTGEIMQVPPMYSALKVNGVKLVDAARRGQVIERKARPATIYAFQDLTLEPDHQHISFSVRCSKGTYIRTLCEDIGDALGLPACLCELERTEASGLLLQDAFRIEEVKQMAAEGSLEDKIIPVDAFLTQYERLTVNENGRKKVLVGNFLSQEDLCEGMITADTFRIYDDAGRFYALYRYSASGACLKPEKMFV